MKEGRGEVPGSGRAQSGPPLLSSDITPLLETWWKLAAATRLPTGSAAQKDFFPAASRSFSLAVPVGDVGRRRRRRANIRVADARLSSETKSNLPMALFGQTDKANQGGTAPPTCRLVPPAHNLISRRRRWRVGGGVNLCSCHRDPMALCWRLKPLNYLYLPHGRKIRPSAGSDPRELKVAALKPPRLVLLTSKQRGGRVCEWGVGVWGGVGCGGSFPEKLGTL